MKIYFIFDGKKHEGPFSIEELQAKGLKRDTYVWKEGLPDWVPAEKIEELEYILPAPSAEPVIVPAPEPAVETKTEVAEEPKKEEPIVVAEKKEGPQPVQQKVAPLAEVKKETPQPAAEQKPQSKFSVEETKSAAVQQKQQQPQPATSTSKPQTVKKSKAGVWILVALVVLAGGGVGYYLYTQNQEKKNNQQADKMNILIPANDTPQVSSSTEENLSNKAEVKQDEVDNSKDEPVVSVIKDKPVKTEEKKKVETKTKETKPDVKKEKTTPTQPKEEKVEVPQVNPLSNLSVNGSYKKNIIGEAVLEGHIANANGNIQFSSVTIEVRFISASGEVLKTQQFTKNGALPGNGSISFKFKTTAPKETRSASYRVVSAH